MCCAVTTYSIGKSVQTMILICRVLLELACFDGKLALVLACKCFELRF